MLHGEAELVGVEGGEADWMGVKGGEAEYLDVKGCCATEPEVGLSGWCSQINPRLTF